jgi:hypothetical protein
MGGHTSCIQGGRSVVTHRGDNLRHSRPDYLGMSSSLTAEVAHTAKKPS